MTDNRFYEQMRQFEISPASVDDKVIASLIPLLRQLDAVNNSSAALMDMTDLRYKYLPNQLKFFPELDGKTAMNEGMALFLGFINDSDRAFIFNTCLASFQFIYSRPPSEGKDYKICFDFRIGREGLPSFRMTQQITVLELNRHGRPWLILIVNDKSPLHDSDVPSRRYMERISDGTRVLFSPDESDTASPISKRELEILGLISRGFGSRDIADYLGISINTVNNHRQHILKKMDTVNSAEAIRIAADLKLL